MPAPKGLTERLLFRHTGAERELLKEVQRVYGAAGVEMSLNDVLRHLVRRAGIILAHTPGESMLQLKRHCAGCEHCELLDYGCAEGLYLFRNHQRVLDAHRGTNGPDRE